MIKQLVDIKPAKDIDTEIKKNFAAFKKRLPDLMKSHPQQHALMRGGEIIEIYHSVEDAIRTARLLYDDELFSVQEITQTPVDLGFFSYAMHQG